MLDKLTVNQVYRLDNGDFKFYADSELGDERGYRVIEFNVSSDVIKEVIKLVKEDEDIKGNKKE